MLLSLIAITRGSELHQFDTKFMAHSKEKYVFFFKGLVKHSKEGKNPPPVDYHSFPEEPNLCPVLALDQYTKITQEWREDNSETNLFLRHLSPHKSVSKSTITRWIKEVMELSGIDIKTFQTHSVRAASSSKFNLKGLSTRDILIRGNWSQKSTWQRYYNKNIVTASQRFQQKLLKGSFEEGQN